MVKGQGIDMKKAKRYISGMTLLIMAAGLLQACGSDQSGEVTSGQGDTDTTTVETEAPRPCQPDCVNISKTKS